ncbi:MAG TPA: hypothetical protein P5127_07120, partial [Oscillospiraceae bacterium]|nr:hypothetical protein [Oscillospiraceae bacterium]
DYSELYAVLNRSTPYPQDHYTTASYTPYQNRITEGWLLYNEQDLTTMEQYMIDDLVAAINGAYNALELKTVGYTVKYQTSDNTSLAADKTGSGKVGSSVTEYPVAVEGYMADQASISKTLKLDANENIFTFTYTKKSYTATFDASGGEGGTSVEVNHGETPVPPTVRRVGYAFAGWTPTLAEATQNATYTAQWVETYVEAKATEDNKIAVQISGFSDDYSYQIWTYQKITGDLILDDKSDVPANQWVLSMPYQKGSTGTSENGKLTFKVNNFTSPNENYTIALRIADENGDYIFELRDTYTPDDLDVAVITKVLVDGEYVKGSAQADDDGYSSTRVVKEIKPGAKTTIKVIGNDVEGL